MFSTMNSFNSQVIKNITTTISTAIEAPIMWYKFNTGDQVSTTVYNYATLAYDGSMGSTTTPIVSSSPTPKIGTGCYAFSTSFSINKSLLANSRSTYGFSTSGFTPSSSYGYSFSMWLYIVNHGTGGNGILLFSIYSSSSNMIALELFSDYVYPYYSYIAGTQISESTLGFVTSSWNHYCLTFTTTTYTLYINGSVKKTGTTTNFYGTTYSNFYFGLNKSPYNGDTFSTYSDMAVDDFRLYAKTLSATEVTNIYNLTDTTA
jgi:hypothetical protein